MQIAVLDTPECPHHLDHLIPLCHFLNAKLIVRDAESARIAEKYYPKIEIEEVISLDQVKEKIGLKYKYLIHSFFWPKQLFNSYFKSYKIKSIYTPHGNSDKYSKEKWMTRFSKQEFCLIYGNHMMDFLREENIFLNQYAYIGNLRFKYYEKHKKFFDKNYSKQIQSNLNPNKKTILYAPTKKAESSFDATNIHFFETLSKEFNLIIKLHPHFIQNHSFIAYPFFGKISQKALIIEDSTLIYPLLNICDALLTDYSSIGYDFLTFDRPLFFLQTDKKDARSTHLHNYGIILDQNSPNVAHTIQKGFEKDLFSEKRKNLYQYVFQSKSTFIEKFSSSFKGGSTKTELSS